MKTINLFEAFSGIGSQHQALKNIGYDVNVVGISDWFIDAIVSYAVNHLGINAISINREEVLSYLKDYSLSLNNKEPAKNIGGLSNDKLSIVYQVIQQFGDLDIRHINGEALVWKDIDLFTYSFPCQDISQQWKQRGFSKGWEETRSGLLWQVERILKEIASIDKKSLPKVLMMENVKALLNKNFEEDLNSWIQELEKLGYKSTKPFVVGSLELWEVQNRERVFMFSFLDETKVKDFTYTGSHTEKYIRDIFEEDMEHKEIVLKKGVTMVEKNPQRGLRKIFLEGYTSFQAENCVYLIDWKAPTVTASWANSSIKVLQDNGKIVVLNALENLKLQGFNKDFYNKMVENWVSEGKIKVMAGNSIHVKVLEELFKFYLWV